jgi:signal transduction histidine kinase
LLLTSVIHDAWQPYARETAERQVQVEQHCDPDVIAEADTTQLRIIIANLFDNAVSYVDVGGKITFLVRRDGSFASVVIENSGYEGQPEDAERLFDRFARGDRARTAGRHCGLGLALSRRLAALLGGTLQASASEGRFRIELRVPLAQQPEPDDIA